MSRKDIIDKLKREVASMPQFDLKCGVCHRKYGKYFVFHHKQYLDSDKIYSDFSDTYAYNEYVLPIIKKDPNRFALLCKKHHTSIERLKMFTPENFERLIKIARESRNDGRFRTKSTSTKRKVRRGRGKNST
tara:strand:+ start:2000 stop:2395 length:396 start_codon:yes stop_codon:yes gene_type:complete